MMLNSDKGTNEETDNSNNGYCCCTSDCLQNLPWRKNKAAKGAAETSHDVAVVDYHFRGRVDSSASLSAANNVTGHNNSGGDASSDVVTQQPTSSLLTTETGSDKMSRHKKSVSSLDSALLVSSVSVLSQILQEPKNKPSSLPYLQISLSWEESISSLILFFIGLRNYHSICLPHSAHAPGEGGSESSPLLPPGSSESAVTTAINYVTSKSTGSGGGGSSGSGGSRDGNRNPAVMLRLCLDYGSTISTNSGDNELTSSTKEGQTRTGSHHEICFSSIQTRTKNPVWKENISIQVNRKKHSEQRVLLVLYETNQYARWTPVKMGTQMCQGLLTTGTQNIMMELHNVTEDVHPFGEIKLSICYNKASHRVYCDILEVRSLLQWALTKKGEYFVKVQFLDHKKVTKMKKSAALRADQKSLIQIFETMRAKVSLANLNSLGIRIMVCDAKILLSDSCLYFVQFGHEGCSGAAEATYWADFLRDVPSSGQKRWFSLHQKQQ